MAQVGSFVPCDKASICVRACLFAHAGAGDCRVSYMHILLKFEFHQNTHYFHLAIFFFFLIFTGIVVGFFTVSLTCLLSFVTKNC